MHCRALLLRALQPPLKLWHPVQIWLSLTATVVACASVLMANAFTLDTTGKLFALTFLLVTFGASDLNDTQGKQIGKGQALNSHSCFNNIKSALQHVICHRLLACHICLLPILFQFDHLHRCIYCMVFTALNGACQEPAGGSMRP